MYFLFQNPKFLYLLFLAPVLIFFHFYHLKNARGKALKFANFEAIARVKGIDLYSKNIIILILDILLVTAIVFSLSGFTLYKEINADSFSYVIAIDASESMSATDLIPNRLSAAKISAKSFVDSLKPKTKVAVISFSWNSYVVQEFSDDKDIVKSSIDKIELTDVGGTDIYEAIMTSSFLLRNEKDKAVIIISDGQLNVGGFDKIIDKALFDKIIVHTIAIGTKEGGKTAFGVSKVDQDALKSLSYSTGGRFFSVESSENMLKSFSEIGLVTKKIGDFDLSRILVLITMILFVIRLIFEKAKSLSI